MSSFDNVTMKDGREAYKCRDCGAVCLNVCQSSQHKCDNKPDQLTPDQLAYIRAAAARWRMDEAGPMMLEALRKAEEALDNIRGSGLIDGAAWVFSGGKESLASVKDAIAAAE